MHTSEHLLMLAGLKSFLSASVVRELGEYTSASVSASYHRQAGLGLTLSTSRQLTQQSEADLSFQVGPESCMSLGLTRQSQRFLVSARLEVRHAQFPEALLAYL